MNNASYPRQRYIYGNKNVIKETRLLRRQNNLEEKISRTNRYVTETDIQDNKISKIQGSEDNTIPKTTPSLRQGENQHDDQPPMKSGMKKTHGYPTWKNELVSTVLFSIHRNEKSLTYLGFKVINYVHYIISQPTPTKANTACP
ncbi:uncharacterized protein EV154DRAFT_487177 [Mucor mucedo]|uniref:uncharacterized protein n=1 Tax=Mucor mucedo TaxID=29922 RepID=UPI00221EA656|nr:uncharacterized protein EV154DRAFT_487177 [Mucor mucedo]KAI7873487.1 hypothetical protein EV154DRAFT_487177 [Mucor mucedo]